MGSTNLSFHESYYQYGFSIPFYFFQPLSLLQFWIFATTPFILVSDICNHSLYFSFGYLQPLPLFQFWILCSTPFILVLDICNHSLYFNFGYCEITAFILVLDIVQPPPLFQFQILSNHPLYFSFGYCTTIPFILVLDIVQPLPLFQFLILCIHSLYFSFGYCGSGEGFCTPAEGSSGGSPGTRRYTLIGSISLESRSGSWIRSENKMDPGHEQFFRFTIF